MFLLFAYNEFPLGGTKDLVACSSSADALLSEMHLDMDGKWYHLPCTSDDKEHYLFWHIFDSDKMTIIAGSEERAELIRYLNSFKPRTVELP